VARQNPLAMLRLFRTIRDLLRSGVVATEYGATFSLDDVQKAVAQAAQPGRHGKVLLLIAPSRG
jgi:NADPH:quinone reductase-like Zn-dependent oxidoreductase